MMKVKMLIFELLNLIKIDVGDFMITKKKKHRLNQEGLTIIELLIAITIIGIVFTLVASFFKVSVEVYNEGNRQTEEQHAVRLAADIVTRELRNATTVDIIDAEPDASSPEEFYIYVNSDNRLVRYETSTDKSVTYTVGDLDDTSYSFVLNDNFLRIEFSSRVVGTETAYELDTEVLLNNISGASDSGKYLGYSK